MQKERTFVRIKKSIVIKKKGCSFLKISSVLKNLKLSSEANIYMLLHISVRNVLTPYVTGIQIIWWNINKAAVLQYVCALCPFCKVTLKMTITSVSRISVLVTLLHTAKGTISSAEGPVKTYQMRFC